MEEERFIDQNPLNEVEVQDELSLRPQTLQQDKVVTVSALAAAGHDQLFASYQSLLPFVRMQVVGDFTAATINPEAWGTGVVTLSDEVVAGLEKQAEALLNA